MNCELERLRREIDDTDEKITKLLKKRMALSAEVAKLKARFGMEIYVPEREKQLLSRITDMAGEQYAKRIKAIYETILAQSRDYQEQLLKNIILIGMPGCGKTSVGRAAAEKLGRDFFDTDSMVEKLAGCGIPELFSERGEEHFRELEHCAVEKAVSHKGAVIATGGGTVLREDNRELLKNNSVIIWLKRDLDTLPVEGRPLSMSGSLEDMFVKRAPLYGMISDITLENDCLDPEETAEKLIGVIKNETADNKRPKS